MPQLISAVHLLSLLFVLLPASVELYICNITHRFSSNYLFRVEPSIEIFQVILYVPSSNRRMRPSKYFLDFVLDKKYKKKRNVRYIALFPEMTLAGIIDERNRDHFFIIGTLTRIDQRLSIENSCRAE